MSETLVGTAVGATVVGAAVGSCVVGAAVGAFVVGAAVGAALQRGRAFGSPALPVGLKKVPSSMIKQPDGRLAVGQTCTQGKPLLSPTARHSVSPFITTYPLAHPVVPKLFKPAGAGLQMSRILASPIRVPVGLIHALPSEVSKQPFGNLELS